MLRNATAPADTNSLEDRQKAAGSSVSAQMAAGSCVRARASLIRSDFISQVPRITIPARRRMAPGRRALRGAWRQQWREGRAEVGRRECEIMVDALHERKRTSLSPGLSLEEVRGSGLRSGAKRWPCYSTITSRGGVVVGGGLQPEPVALRNKRRRSMKAEINIGR